MADKKKKSSFWDNLSWDKISTAIEAAFSDDSKPKKAAHEDGPPWIKYVAMLTGALAALAGFLAVRSTTLTNGAIYESNQAVLAQAEASDAWAEYQADSIKARIVETQMAATLLPDAARAELQKQDQDLRDRQPVVKQAALDKTSLRDKHLQAGERRLADKDLLNYADLLAQIGIALASVAALSKRRSAFAFGVAAGVAGVLLTAYVFIAHYLAQ